MGRGYGNLGSSSSSWQQMDRNVRVSASLYMYMHVRLSHLFLRAEQAPFQEGKS
jgi:hypothetical protein